MNVSDGLVNLLKNYEELRLEAYIAEPDGPNEPEYTIGYGSFNRAGVTADTIITEEQAEAWLREDLAAHEARVSSIVNVPLTQNQFDALVSFSFNTYAGTSDSVWREINAGNTEQAMIEMAGWRSSNGEQLRGLYARRNDEIELFVSGDTTRDDNYTDHYENQDEITQFIAQAVVEGIVNGTISTDEADDTLSSTGLGLEEGVDNGTNSDTYDHEIDIDTDFSHGNSEQETQTDAETVAGVQGGTVYSEGNASVNSSTANDDGFWSIVNNSVTDGYQPGRSNLSSNQVTSTVSEIWYSPLLSSQPPTDTQTSGSITSLLDFSWLSGLSSNLAEIDPLVLDLDGDGIELTSFAEQYLYFDIDNDGSQERTGWVGQDDGMLVHDLNGDGQINDITETLSEYYDADKGTGAIWDSSFAALESLDSNSDGVINASDDAFAELKVWQDSNQDGVTDEGELKTLAELDITELSLSDTTDGAFIGGNEVKSNSTYTNGDGTTQTLAAVNFIADPNGLTSEDDGTGQRIEVQDGSSTYAVGDELGETVDATDKDVTNIIGGTGDDVLTGNAEDNWLVGSLGEDQLSGGVGNDYLVADAADIANTQANIQGGDGFDIVQFVGEEGVTFNLQESQIEMAVGTDQSDVLVSGSSDQSIIDGGLGDDIIIGGSADDVLNGEEGDDTVYGHLGDDLIRGHRGNDKLVGGGGEDILQGGLGNDVLSGGAGEDLLNGGEGDDHLDGGDGYDVAQYSGSYGDYRVEANSNGTYTVTDRRANGTDGVDVLENIEALNFADINEVQLDTDNPLPVKDTVHVTAEADGRTYRVAISDLLANDLDYQDDSLSITDAFDAKGGTVSIDGDDVVFLLDEGFAGIPTFSYRIQDANGNDGVLVGVTGSNETAEMSAQVTLVLDHHPDDPDFVDQWYLSDINVLPVWEDYTGAGVSVGVFEIGPWDGEEYGQIDYSHSDLITNIDAEALRTQNTNIEATQHATLVAGVIAAARNDIGGVGVAYDATLSSEGISQDDVSALLNWSSYDITNNSWGPTDQFSYTLTDGDGNPFSYTLLENAVTYGRDGLGTIMVMAGGNDRQNGHDTNGSDLTNNRFGITVGAINAEGDLSNLEIAADPFSNPGASILVSAPGSNITSTSILLENDNGSTFGSDYETTQGTSFAAPIVSGVVALMLEANPNLGWRDVQEILALTAKKIDDPNTEWKTNGATNVNGGGMHFSQDYGFGLVDAEAAVRLAESWLEVSTSANEEEVVYQSGESSADIPDDGTDFTSTITVTDELKLENIEVTLDLQHSQMGDVEIVLISPDGTESILINRPDVALNSDGTDRGYGAFDDVWTTSSTNHWGENSAGDWTLVVRDTVTGETGVLEGWELRLYGEQDTEDDVYIFTSEFNGQVNGFQNETGGTDTINTAALTSDTVINLAEGSANINGYDTSFELSAEEVAAQIAGLETQLTTEQQKLGTITAELTSQQTYLDSLQQQLADNPNIIDDLYMAYTDAQTALSQAQSDVDDWDENFGRADDSYSIGGTVVLLDSSAQGSDRFIVAEYVSLSAYQADATTYQAVIETYNNAINELNATISNYNETYAELSSLPDLIETVDALQTEVSLQELAVSNLESELSVAMNINGNAVIENVITGIGDDQLIGSDIDNVLIAGSGDDVLEGNGGDDTLRGDDGNDILTGGAGTDVLYGGEGDDTFIWSQGDGSDVIDDSFGSNSLILTDINPDDVSISKDNYDAVITINSTGETIRLDQQLLAGGLRVINFADGTQWDEDTIAEYASHINGTDADDNLVGSSDDDVIVGGKGDDNLEGGFGDDTYYYSLGDGSDVIDDTSGNNSLILTDINPEDVSVSKDNYDAVITISSTGETITLDSQFLLGGRVSTISFADGTQWDEDTIAEYASHINGTDADENLVGSSDDDVIVGGKGDDNLEGGFGDDTYYYSLGDGSDVIDDTSGNNSLILTDINPEDVSVSKDNYDAVITISSTGETITLDSQFLLGGRVSTISFADGTQWDEDTIAEYASHINGTDADENLVGSSDDDVIVGGKGDDNLEGGFGDDTYYYSLGDGSDVIDDTSGNNSLILTDINPEDVSVSKDNYDAVITISSTGETITLDSQFLLGGRVSTISFADGTQWDEDTIAEYASHINGTDADDNLVGSSDDDVIVGGEGDDNLEGGFGDDVIVGGKGDDNLEGDFGNDTYYYSLGDGSDVIDDTSGNNNLILTDINPEDVSVSKDSYDAVITISSTGATITLDSQFSFGGVSAISFADGTQWDEDTIAEYASHINGTDADDNIVGSSDDDVIAGGKGDDNLEGGFGDDTYYYSLGDGSDVIDDTSGNNSLILTDINPVDVSVSKDSFDAVITINSTGETIRLDKQLFFGGISVISFADGTQWDEDTIAEYATRINGTDADDDLAGSFGDDVIVGGQGNDTLDGGYGDDTYYYSLGDGNDVIDDTLGSNSLTLTDINPEDVSVSKDNYDAVITINSTGETITLNGQFSFGGISAVSFSDGTQWTADNIAEYASWIQGTDSNDTLVGTSEADRIEGGKGNDLLTGGADDDAFVFADNFGADTVTDFTDGDVIEFSGNTFDSYASVLAAAVEDGDDTVITLDLDNSITLNNVALADLQADDFRFV